jgi:hypothetical protein
VSAGVAGTTPFRPTPSYTTLRDVTAWVLSGGAGAVRAAPAGGSALASSVVSVHAPDYGFMCPIVKPAVDTS